MRRDSALPGPSVLTCSAGAIDSRWAPQRVDLVSVSFGDGGRAGVLLTPELEGNLYGLFSSESVATLNGENLYHEAQRGDFVPVPTRADLAELSGDSLGDLTDADPAAVVGKTNDGLWNEFGLAVDGEPVPGSATRSPDVEGGYVAGASGGGGSESDDGLIQHVVSAAGSLFEVGRLAQGERLYVYVDEELIAVPGTYAGLPYVRPESEDAGGDRRSFYHVRLARPATVYVAYDVEASASWLAGWTDTGTPLGTTDEPRRVYARESDGGLVTPGPCRDTHRMYTVFAAER